MTAALDQLAVEYGGIPLGLVARPRNLLDLPGWMASHHRELDQLLLVHGAVLFRGFPINVTTFARITRVHSEPASYQLGTAPRGKVAEDVFESTRFDPRLKLPLHNEQSYLRTWPRTIWFFSEVVAPVGGATPLAWTRRITRRIPPGVKDMFRKRQICYHRVYEHGLIDDAVVQPISPEGRLPVAWQTAFGTTDPRVVEHTCDALGVAYRWQPSGRLQTSNVVHAFARHPDTREEFWFNQVHNLSFHGWGVDVFGADAAREPVSDAALARLPRHVTFGDGSPIGPELVAELNEIYRLEETTFAWQPGDLLVLDNVLVAHGRQPYAGPRRVLAALTGAARNEVM